MQRREGYRRVRRGTIRYVGNSFTAGSQVDGLQRYALSNALKPCRAQLQGAAMLPIYRLNAMYPSWAFSLYAPTFVGASPRPSVMPSGPRGIPHAGPNPTARQAGPFALSPTPTSGPTGRGGCTSERACLSFRPSCGV